LNENLRFYVDLSNVDELTTNEIEDEVDDVVATKKSRIQTKLQEVEESVDNAISSNEIGHLDGKLIFSHIAAEFDLPKEQLKRVVADKINREHEIPPDLNDIISVLFDSIGETYSAETHNQ
jgi:hypothetical protein